MKLDWTVNIGILIHLAGMILAGIALYVRFEIRFTALETKMQMLMEWFKNETLPTRVVRTETVRTERGPA